MHETLIDDELAEIIWGNERSPSDRLQERLREAGVSAATRAVDQLVVHATMLGAAQDIIDGEDDVDLVVVG